MTADVAIAHGQLTSDGGAERVAIDLARLFDAPIFSPAVDHEFVPADVDAQEVMHSAGTDWLEALPLPHTAYWLGKHLSDIQRRQYCEELHEFDIVIESKPAMSWYVPKTEQTIIRYVHHPQRQHYDQFHRKGSSAIGRCWSAVHRTLHRQTVNWPDLIVCNSELTRRRVRRYWRVADDRLSVVYPGVGVSKMGPQIAETRGHYLYLGRLAANKRIPLLVDIAERTDHEIVVAGDGPQRDVVENCDADNLTVLGYVCEDEKRRLLSETRALLFGAEEEDFGIVPIEALASGTPVIAANEGYQRLQINHGNNGLLVRPTAEAFAGAMDVVEKQGVGWSPEAIEASAEQFGTEQFRTGMRGALQTATRRATLGDQDVPERPEMAVTDGGEADA